MSQNVRKRKLLFVCLLARHRRFYSIRVRVETVLDVAFFAQNGKWTHVIHKSMRAQAMFLITPCLLQITHYLKGAYTTSHIHAHARTHTHTHTPPYPQKVSFYGTRGNQPTVRIPGHRNEEMSGVTVSVSVSVSLSFVSKRGRRSSVLIVVDILRLASPLHHCYVTLRIAVVPNEAARRASGWHNSGKGTKLTW